MATIERDNRGQFAKGNKGGPGRPPLSKEQKFLRTTTSRVTLKEWREIIDKAVEQAKEGDKYAREWLSKVLIGDRKDLNITGNVNFIWDLPIEKQQEQSEQVT